MFGMLIKPAMKNMMQINAHVWKSAGRKEGLEESYGRSNNKTLLPKKCVSLTQINTNAKLDQIGLASLHRTVQLRFFPFPWLWASQNIPTRILPSVMSGKSYMLQWKKRKRQRWANDISREQPNLIIVGHCTYLIIRPSLLKWWSSRNIFSREIPFLLLERKDIAESTQLIA